VLGIEFTVPVALLTVMTFEAWRYFPFAFLFLTARIQALPRDLEKAAQMDGATVSQRFRYVVFPQLLPTIALLAVLRFIFTFNEFDDIYLLTGGGPAPRWSACGCTTCSPPAATSARRRRRLWCSR
jgi:multiple sugar transport system permease protein